MTHQGQTGIYFISGGYRLLGTLFLAQGDEPKPTAIILHGIPGIEKNYDLAQVLRRRGWNGLIFHYRGCWGSEGHYCIETIPEDVKAAVGFLSGGNCPQVDPSRLYLIGHSLGGWAGVQAAAADRRVQGVVAIATLSDPRELSFTEQDAAASFSPWLTGMTPQGFISQWQRLGQLDLPISKVAQISPRPILIIHGKGDELIPFRQSQELFENAKEPRELILHSKANHSFIWYRPWLISKVWTWLEKVSAPEKHN